MRHHEMSRCCAPTTHRAAGHARHATEISQCPRRHDEPLRAGTDAMQRYRAEAFSVAPLRRSGSTAFDALPRRGIGSWSSKTAVRFRWMPSDFQIRCPDPFQPLAIEVEHAHGRPAYGRHAHDLEPIGRPGEMIVPPVDARAE
jgi:hypothetical protein